MKKIIFSILASASLANAAFTITGGAVSNLGNEADPSVGLTSATTYAILVALNDDPFDGLVMGDTISVGQTVGDGRYYVLQVGTSFDPGGDLGQVGQVNISNFDTTGTPIANNAAIGNHVAFVWFPGLVGSELNEEDVYGVIRGLDWVLPSDLGGSLTFSNFATAGDVKRAQFSIPVIIPEPTSLALLGLGALTLITRRRRD